MHICYGYGIKANIDWKKTLGDEWRQYEKVFPALARSSIQQVSLECIHSHVPPDLMALLDGQGRDGRRHRRRQRRGRDARSRWPTRSADALQFVPRERLIACTNCGMAPMDRAIALAKLEALAKGAALAQRKA